MTRKRDAKSIQPNQTLYVKNINEKVKQTGKSDNQFRAEAVSVSSVLDVRPGAGYQCQAHSQDERLGLYSLLGS